MAGKDISLFVERTCTFDKFSRRKLNVFAMRLNRSPFNRFFSFVLLFAVFPVSRCYFAANEFDEKIAALLRVVNFLIHRGHQMNVDGLYGITLAEVNVLATLRHPNINFLQPEYRTFLAYIYQQLYQARINIKKKVRPESKEVALINAVLNDPKIWIKPICWTTLGSRIETRAELNKSTVEESIFRGSPTEKESDYCIAQLIILDKKISQRCQLSEHCTNILLKNDNPAGYALTHRLLYVQIARALGCQKNRKLDFVQLIREYCEEILQNLYDAESTNFPGVYRDLAIEQVLLCGMEGFLNFTDNHYAKVIRSWAHPSGCYNSKGFPQNDYFGLEKNIPSGRRSSGKMDFDCENHTSGLAAGVLALFIRESVENLFSLASIDNCKRNE